MLVTKHALRSRDVKVFAALAVPFAVAVAVADHWHTTLTVLFTMTFTMMVANVIRYGVQLGRAEPVPAQIKAHAMYRYKTTKFSAAPRDRSGGDEGEESPWGVAWLRKSKTD